MAEENNQPPESQSAVASELMCPWPNCGRGSFRSPQALNVHIARAHKKKWSSVPRGAKKKKGRFVGLPVKKVASPSQEKPKMQGWDPRVVRFCPCCGTNVRNVQAAVAMGG